MPRRTNKFMAMSAAEPRFGGENRIEEGEGGSGKPKVAPSNLIVPFPSSQKRQFAVSADIPSAFKFLWGPCRYKVAYGGRGGAKSTAFASTLAIMASQKLLRVLCVREYQTSIGESVHKLLSDRIAALGLDKFYNIQKTRIAGRNGSEFIFKGIRTNIAEIKSLEGVDICWVEEGQSVSETSWDVLIPTIRKENSEIWVSFNPVNDSDATYRRFVSDPPPGAAVVKVGWEDNPYLPETLYKEMEYCRDNDPDAYDWIWRGNCRKISDAQVFKGIFEVKEFTTPPNVRFYHGADWGYAEDPCALVRCFIDEGCLYIDKELYEKHVELDDLPRFFRKVDTAHKWPIFGDAARPDIIKHLLRRGINIKKCEKWSGSIEAGISYIRNFNKVIIHPSCTETINEFERYSYKQDRVTNEILPVPLDKYNHCIDALRYALTKRIKKGLNNDIG